MGQYVDGWLSGGGLKDGMVCGWRVKWKVALRRRNKGERVDG